MVGLADRFTSAVFVPFLPVSCGEKGNVFDCGHGIVPVNSFLPEIGGHHRVGVGAGWGRAEWRSLTSGQQKNREEDKERKNHS